MRDCTTGTVSHHGNPGILQPEMCLEAPFQSFQCLVTLRTPLVDISVFSREVGEGAFC